MTATVKRMSYRLFFKQNKVKDTDTFLQLREQIALKLLVLESMRMMKTLICLITQKVLALLLQHPTISLCPEQP